MRLERRTVSLETADVLPPDSLSREPYGCEMDAPVICQQIRDTFTYPLMLRLFACNGFSREALLPLQVRNAAA